MIIYDVRVIFCFDGEMVVEFIRLFIWIVLIVLNVLLLKVDLIIFVCFGGWDNWLKEKGMVKDKGCRVLWGLFWVFWCWMIVGSLVSFILLFFYYILVFFY